MPGMQTSIPGHLRRGMQLKHLTLSFRNPLIFLWLGRQPPGRIAADNMPDHHSLYHGSQGHPFVRYFR